MGDGEATPLLAAPTGTKTPLSPYSAAAAPVGGGQDGGSGIFARPRKWWLWVRRTAPSALREFAGRPSVRSLVMSCLLAGTTLLVLLSLVTQEWMVKDNYPLSLRGRRAYWGLWQVCVCVCEPNHPPSHPDSRRVGSTGVHKSSEP